MPYTALYDTGAQLVAEVKPVSGAASTNNSGWVNMGLYERIMAVAQVGSWGAGNTLDFKLQQAKDSSGTGAKDISNTAITQLTQANFTNNDVQAVINCGSEQLDTNNGFCFARMVATVGGTNTAVIAASMYGDGETKPPTDISTVAQVVRL